MKEPKRIPLDPATPKIPSVKKIPMPSVEKELHDLIEDSKQYLNKVKKHSSDSWQIPILMIYLVKHFFKRTYDDLVRTV